MKMRSIRSTIFNQMLLTVSAAAAVSVAAMLLIVSIVFGTGTRREITMNTNRTADYMNSLSSTEERLSFLRSMYDDREDERASFIAHDGGVLYDNDADASRMENHLSRPEVRAARDFGSGFATRSSETVGRRVFYYAVRLEGGSVLRTERPLTEVYDVLPALAPASLLLLAVIVFMTAFRARSITRHIMRPIYNTDINNIDESAVYPELLPYFSRIKAENEEREKNDALRREFSANVSHELKTPLTIISGYAQMINNGMARPEDTAVFGLKIEKEAERLLLLIDDIIRLSNLDETKTVRDPEEVRLDEAAREAARQLETRAASRGITVSEKLEPCAVSGSATLIGEMIFNLVDNAIKYNKDNGEVELRTRAAPECAVFSVQDTGIGIDREDTDRIFERFYRVDKSRSRTIGGTGLGLSIVKHAAMIHGAKVEVESEPGVGTLITVRFKPE